MLKLDSRWIAFPPFALAAVWYSHVAHTLLDDPLGITFDLALYLSCAPLKIATMACLPFLVMRALAPLHRDFRRSLNTFFAWSLAIIAFFVTASVTREWWAFSISGGAARYYTVSNDMSHMGEIGTHWNQWRTDWTSGVVTSIESLVAIAVAACAISFGYFLGGRLLSGILATVVGIAASAFYAVSVNWILLDFDNFHGDIIYGAILFECGLFFLPSDPYTSIGTAVYVAIAASCIATAVRHSNIASSVEK